jgi:type II secretion system protein I
MIMRPSVRGGRASLARRTAANRMGFTLIELMVAMMIFTVGVLATMSSAAAVMKVMGGSQRLTVASTVAEARFERLRSQSCAVHTNGSTQTRGVRESWTVYPLVQADDVTVMVTYPVGGGRVISQTYKTYVPC